MNARAAGAAAVAVAGATALFCNAAAGAVPKAKWYWTLAVSARDADTLLLGTSDGLYRSQDAGKSWRRSPAAKMNATSIVQAGDTLYLGGVRTRAGAKPVIVAGGAYVSGPGTTVLERSTDDGNTWTELHPRGLPNAGVQALAVDPKKESTVYAVVRTGALYRSDDGAGSFRLVTPTVGGTPWAVAVTPGQLLTGDMTSGSYVSPSGTRWSRTPFTDPKGGAMVMEYAVQPANARHVLMTSYGVLASANAGKTWHVVLKSKVMFGPVGWAPSSPAVAYATGWDRSVWRSVDGGRTWKRTS
jgi:photosystem II stability/assembly factor-like uncharacterized protein